MGWGVRDYPQPVDDNELSEGEYAQARIEAAHLTQQRISDKLKSYDEDTLADIIRVHILDEQRPNLAHALAGLYMRTEGDEWSLWVKHELENELHRIVADEVKAVDVEDVLSAWHEAPDTAYDDYRQRQIDADAAGDIKHQRSVDDRMDYGQEAP